jgi:hypothetical protein
MLWMSWCAIRWKALVPPLILAAVATVQIYRAHFERLTPWKGGGFGMFAQNQSASSRLLRCYVAMRGKDGKLVRTLVPVPKGTGLSRQVEEVLAVPSAARVKALASALRKQDWRLFEAKASPMQAPGPQDGGVLLLRAAPEAGLQETGRRVPLGRIELEVHEAKFDTLGLRFVPELIERQVVEERTAAPHPVAQLEGARP